MSGVRWWKVSVSFVGTEEDANLLRTSIESFIENFEDAKTLVEYGNLGDSIKKLSTPTLILGPLDE